MCDITPGLLPSRGRVVVAEGSWLKLVAGEQLDSAAHCRRELLMKERASASRAIVSRCYSSANALTEAAAGEAARKAALKTAVGCPERGEQIVSN